MSAQTVDEPTPAEAPDWFRDAVATPATVDDLVVDGARIAVRSWTVGCGPDVVLVHGGAANARWWDHVAPLLGSAGRVVALDLSGHGQSDWRAAYSRDQWAAEVAAVARTLGPAPVVVGHSLGGFITLAVAGRYGDELGGAIVVDTPIRSTADEVTRSPWRGERDRVERSYPTEDEIVRRFRPLPEHTPLAPYLREYLGRRSFRATPDGYAWQFDPAVFRADGITHEELDRPSCRMGLIRAERGSMTREGAERLAPRTGPRTLQLTIPDSGHHVMLDQPLALATAVDALVASWSEAARHDTTPRPEEDPVDTPTRRDEEQA